MTEFQWSGYFVIQKLLGRKLTEVVFVSGELPQETSHRTMLISGNPSTDGKVKVIIREKPADQLQKTECWVFPSFHLKYGISSLKKGNRFWINQLDGSLYVIPCCLSSHYTSKRTMHFEFCISHFVFYIRTMRIRSELSKKKQKKQRTFLQTDRFVSVLHPMHKNV